MTAIKIIKPGEDYAEASKIRFAVFVEEQGVPQEHEYDENDKIAYHALLYDGKIPVACGRIYFTGNTAKIGRVAVLINHRHKGYATIICNKLIETALGSEKKINNIVLHAQSYTVPLYEKLGFEIIGDEFFEENIPHYRMERVL
jgi:predicted GNAT family N-acyltransferase